MNAIAPVARRRSLLLLGSSLLLAAATIGWGPGGGQRAEIGRAALAAPAVWTAIGTSGTVGTATLADSAETPGASCRIDRRFTPGFMDVIASGPTVGTATGVASQVVSWRITLVQIGPGNAETVVGTTAAVTRTATDAQPVALPALEFLSQPLGPRYVVDATVSWHDPALSTDVTGTSTFRINFYLPLNDRGTPLGRAGNSCRSPEPPSATIPTARGTVNGRVAYSLGGVPVSTSLGMAWDGRSIGSIVTDETGAYAGTFVVPATTIGPHTIAWSAGTWTASARYDVVPRVKVIPGTVSREQRVDISLRGFAKKETVRVRWKRGGSWVELATVLTSNTGSANVWVVVPAWAADGAHSVRGDGSIARAQTNAVTVSGGAFRAAEESTPATPTPTATPTVPASPTPGASPTASVDPYPTETPIPSEPTAPTATPEPTSTPEPVEPTATIEPTSTPTAAPPTDPPPGSPAAEPSTGDLPPG